MNEFKKVLVDIFYKDESSSPKTYIYVPEETTLIDYLNSGIKFVKTLSSSSSYQFVISVDDLVSVRVIPLEDQI